MSTLTRTLAATVLSVGRPSTMSTVAEAGAVPAGGGVAGDGAAGVVDPPSQRMVASAQSSSPLVRARRGRSERGHLGAGTV
jgi:hypothetical protein